MFEVERIEEWRGQAVVDPNGDKIGKLEELYTDLDSGEPGIGCVKTGLFGRHLSLVPLTDASLGRDYVRLPYTKDQVRDAPRAEPGGQLTRADEVALFEHYGLEPPPAAEGGPRHLRYETPEAEQQRRAAAEEARARAAFLEGEAERKQMEAEVAAGDARDAVEHAQRARRERDDALRRAQEEREAAERALEP